MSKLTVSVIIPTYNRANIVGQAIESVLSQSYANIEIIVVDDGSTDNTLQMLGRYANRITVISQENAGPSAARNKGIQAANGDILAFLDSDDLWMPSKLDRQINVLSRVDDSVPCCITNALIRYADGTERNSFEIAKLKPSSSEGIWLNVAEVLSTRFVFFTQAIAIRRKAIQKAGMFDVDLLFMEDHDLAIRMALLGPWVYIEEPLVQWRGGSENSLCDEAVRNPAHYYECVEKLYENIINTQTINSLRVAHNLRHKLSSARRELLAQRLLKRNNIISDMTAWCLRGLNRLSDGLLRRMPTYPGMEVAPLPQVAGD